MPEAYSFETSWTTAEAAVYAKFLTATSAVDKKSAYLGLLPANMVNVWGMTSGKPRNEQTLWPTEIVSVHIEVNLTGQFAERANAQKFAMQILKATPWNNLTDDPAGNVATVRYREGAFSEPRLQAINAANEDAPVLAWVIDLSMEMVFTTGGREGPAPA